MIKPNFAPKKSLGQHFLNSKHVLEQIISASKIQKRENVLEIGPGTGILTRRLLDCGARVVAVEKDSRSIKILKQTFFREIKSEQLILISGDILEEKINSELLDNSIIENSFALIANIPYYITGAILEKFLEYGPRPNRMILLVQKEVAERIVARDNKESVLSVSVKIFGTPKTVAKVPPSAFTPPPNVDSAILSIHDISAGPFSSKNLQISRFFKILKAGFAHKRKYLARNLEAVLSKNNIENIWNNLKLNPKIRAEDLKISQWLEISTSNQ